MADPFCDENGVCTPAELADHSSAQPLRKDAKIVYVGDPMCSWCWGIAPGLQEVRTHYSERGIPFEIIVGGLRPGGGDPWDDNMKSFLMHHWQEVTARSGQPFGYKLFDRQHFHYDTEPSCRAVVVAKDFLDEGGVLRFFEAIQRKFYVDNEDPTDIAFYDQICQGLGIRFDEFSALFESDEVKSKTREEFMLNRQWGVKGYPTVVLQIKDQLFLVTNGFATADVMKERIDRLLEEATAPSEATA